MRKSHLHWGKMLISMTNLLWTLKSKRNHQKSQMVSFPNQCLASPSEVTFQGSSEQTQQPPPGRDKSTGYYGKWSLIYWWLVSIIPPWSVRFTAELKLKAFSIPAWCRRSITGRPEGLWLLPNTPQSVTLKSVNTPVTNVMNWHGSSLTTSEYW